MCMLLETMVGVSLSCPGGTRHGLQQDDWSRVRGSQKRRLARYVRFCITPPERFV